MGICRIFVIIKVGRLWRADQKTGASGCSTHAISLVNDDLFDNDENEETLNRLQRLQNRLSNGKAGNFIVKYKVDEIIENEVKKEFGDDHDEYDEE